MSSSLQIHLGAYLEVKDVQKKIDKDVFGCKDHPKVYVDTGQKHCGTCGNILTSFTISEEVTHCPLNEEEQFIDELCAMYLYDYADGDITYYASNKVNCGTCIEIDEGENKIELRNLNDDIFINTFRTLYHDILKWLDDNDHEYSVKFGILTWYN